MSDEAWHCLSCKRPRKYAGLVTRFGVVCPACLNAGHSVVSSDDGIWIGGRQVAP